MLEPFAFPSYFESLYKNLKAQGAFTLLQQMLDGTATSTTAELANQMFGTASDQADKACKKRRPELYSKPLTQQRLKVSLLKAHHIDQKHKERKRQAAFHSRMSQAGFHFPLPDSLAATETSLQESTVKHAIFRINMFLCAKPRSKLRLTKPKKVNNQP